MSQPPRKRVCSKKQIISLLDECDSEEFSDFSDSESAYAPSIDGDNGFSSSNDSYERK